jgi:hypothetical protein
MVDAVCDGMAAFGSGTYVRSMFADAGADQTHGTPSRSHASRRARGPVVVDPSTLG